MEANCEHRMHFGLGRRTPAAPTRPVTPSERASLRKHRLPAGCFRKLRATVRVHLDTVKRRKLARDALIFLEISLLNEPCSTRPAVNARSSLSADSR